MSQRFARLLNDQDLVDHFLTEVLDFDYSGLNNIAYEIIQEEQGLFHLGPMAQTLNTSKFRDRKFYKEADRWALRRQIIEELLSQMRPENDDDICLGKGGALPQSGVAAGKQAYILIGLPASGKSGIGNEVCENYNAIVLDSDYAKRKLPEFSGYKFGASVVHEESSQIVFGFYDNPRNLDALNSRVIELGFNVVIPKIGHDAKSILTLAASMNEAGYECHLTLVSLLKRESTIRAIHRFHVTKRYVPLGLNFDGYGNDPCLTYHLLKNKASDVFKSFGAVSTNVPIGDAPVCIDLTEGNPAGVYGFKENILI